MEIGILADSHDRLPALVKALEYFEENSIRHLIHAGDFISPFAVRALLKFRGEIHAVLGNNDGEREGLKKLLPDMAEDILELTLDGKKIVVAHKADMVGKKKLKKYDAAIFGHTHKAEIREGNPLIINPGEACGWLYDRCTLAVLDLSRMKARIVTI